MMKHYSDTQNKGITNFYRFRAICFVILSFVVLQSSGCDINDNDDEFTDSFSYQITEQSVVSVDSVQQPAGPDSTITVLTFDVVPGDSTVFQYQHNVIPPDDVVDGGFFETLVFQIPFGTDRFEFRDEELLQASTLYGQSNAFQFLGAGVSKGIIRGERLSPIHWIIRADVRIETAVGNFEIEFEEPFYVK